MTGKPLLQEKEAKGMEREPLQTVGSDSAWG